MTLGEYMHKVDANLQNELQTWINVQIGSGALALIASRVRQKGETSGNTDFKPYSTKTTLIGASSFTSKTYADKVFGSKKKRQELDWRTVHGHHLALLPGGYKAIREIEGRQTGHKDFERTSEMWKSIHVMGTKETTPGNFQTTIGSQVSRSVKIMEGIHDKEGYHLLDLSDKEVKLLNEKLGGKVAQIFNE